MEVINLRLNYNFEMVQKRVKLSFGGREPSNISGQCQESSGETFQRHSKLVEELRKEICAKCDAKMPNYQPRVQIEKISVSMIRKATKMERLMSLKPRLNSKDSYETKGEPIKNISKGASIRDIFSDSDSISQLQAEFVKEEPENDVDGPYTRSVFDDAESPIDFNSEQKVCQSISSSSIEAADIKITEKVTDSYKMSRHQNEESTKPNGIPPKGFMKFKANKAWNKSQTKKTITEMICCTKCDKTFHHQASLYYHFNTVHLHKRYKCQTCNTVYKYQTDLRKHKKICRENIEKRLARERDPKFKFVCEICGKRWDKLGNLKVHRRRVHESAPPNRSFSCDICKKTFNQLQNLKAHKDGIHLGKKFPCRFCKKEFSQRSGLNRHEKFCRQK